MSNSTIRIVFSPEALSGFTLFNHVMKFDMFHNTNIEVKETFTTVRTMPYYSTIGSPPIPTRLIEALLLDYPNLFTATADGSDAVIIESLFGDTTFSAVDTEYLTYEITNVITPINPVALTVTGLNSNGYLINNEINISIDSTEEPVYFKIKISNLTNQKQASDKIVYPNDVFKGKASLQGIIKSLFTYPSDADGYVIPNQIVPNSNKYRIQIYYNPRDVDGNPTTELLGYDVTKNFIRGGKRSTLTNLVVTNSASRPGFKLPVWDGFPTAMYYVDEQFLIRKMLMSDVPLQYIDQRRKKGCNEIYVKFADQNGGYLNWLFESKNEIESNVNLGGFVRNNLVDDLGNESNSTIQAMGKIPSEYSHYINDLIVSPEIYVLLYGAWVRVRSKNNSVTVNENKRSYQVTINYDVDYRFNPSLLWSN